MAHEILIFRGNAKPFKHAQIDTVIGSVIALYKDVSENEKPDFIKAWAEGLENAEFGLYDIKLDQFFGNDPMSFKKILAEAEAYLLEDSDFISTNILNQKIGVENNWNNGGVDRQTLSAWFDDFRSLVSMNPAKG